LLVRHPELVEVTVAVTTGSLVRFVTVRKPPLSIRATPAVELTDQL